MAKCVICYVALCSNTNEICNIFTMWYSHGHTFILYSEKIDAMLCLSSYKTQNNEFHNTVIEKKLGVIILINFNTWLLF